MDALADLLIRIRAATTAKELWALWDEARRFERQAADVTDFAAHKAEVTEALDSAVVRVEIPL